MVLGKEVMHQHDLVLLKDGYFDGYDQYTNPSAASGFTSAAFRYNGYGMALFMTTVLHTKHLAMIVHMLF